MSDKLKHPDDKPPHTEPVTRHTDCAPPVPPLHFAGVPYQVLESDGVMTPVETTAPASAPAGTLERKANFSRPGFGA